MRTPGPMCPKCSRPILLSVPGSSPSSQLAHLKCQETPRSANTWPGGMRHVLCLNCGRDFESTSKAQRLCRACRSAVV
jgi:DNA-directed RNA polymerase subunit RPC12/RpoP